MTAHFTRRLRAAALATSLCLGVVAGQEPAPSGRHRVSDTAPPAIDRGLHDADPPAPSRAFGQDRIDRSALTNRQYLQGSVIVKFRVGASSTQRSMTLSRVGGAITTAGSYTNFEIVSIDSAADPEAVAADLSSRSDVEYAQARYRVYPSFTPNDPLYSRQWNFPAIDMERAWDLNPGASSSVIVAVLDSGVAYRNATLRFNAPGFTADGQRYPALGTVEVPFAAAPELGGQDRFVTPRDFIWGDETPLDMDGHGTHVAGTIGQLTNNGVGVAGMAFNVRLMPVKVIDTAWDIVFDSPFFATDDVVARGIRYAADNGAKVLNMSIGRGGSPAPVLRDAMQYAVSRGAFLVVSAGNEFEQDNELNRLAEFAPDIQGMVAVGAIGRDRIRAFYSNTGPHIELVAPGGDTRRNGSAGGILQQTFDEGFVDTFSLGPARYRAPRFDVFAFEFYQGTSMAAPHVSGFAALLIQQGITSPAAIEAIMKRYATDLGAPGRDNEYGYGLINPRATLRGMGLIR